MAMKLLRLLSPLLFQFQGIIGMMITNTLSNSRPRLGETITLSCNIKGGTASIVFWWKDKNQDSGAINMSYNCSVVSKDYKSRLRNVQCDMTNYNFQLSNVQISDGGDWVCEADGQEATTTLRLDILVAPNVQINTSKTTVYEHEFVWFECATSGGNPEHVKRYQWLWNKDNTTAAQVIQDSGTSTENGKFLEFARIRYNMSGIYSCKAWNLGGMGQASTVLNVQYSPRIDPEALKKYVVASVIGKEATFQLFIIANPTPTTAGYVWSKDGNVLSSSSPKYEIISGPTFSKLTVKNIKSSDYTNYTCSVKTTVFQAEVFKFMLLKAGPSTPSNLEVVNLTAVAATLKWISESNGGHEQRFFVQYKKSAENWPTSEVPQGGIEDDPGLKKVVYHSIKDLESNTWYQFRVRSKNSHPGTHTSDFSNTAAGKTPEKPQTSLIGVTRVHNTVTVRWKQVTGNYTALKIVYCQTGTEDCRNYTVPNPEDNIAAFIVANMTYYYYLMVEDGSDVVYKSTKIAEEVDDKSNSRSVDDKTSTVFAIVSGVVGAGIGTTAVIIVAVVLWKRGLLRLQWGKKQSHRPANDNADYDDTRVELATAGKGSAQTYYNIGTGHKPVADHGVLGNDPIYPDDSIDAYDYVDSPRIWQPSVSGENPAPEPQENQTECAAANEQCGQDVSSGKREEQEGQVLEGMASNIKILIQEQPGHSIAESGSSQANEAHGQTPSLSDDDMAQAQESSYAHLGPVEPVRHGEYLDLRKLSSE